MAGGGEGGWCSQEESCRRGRAPSWLLLNSMGEFTLSIPDLEVYC